MMKMAQINSSSALWWRQIRWHKTALWVPMQGNGISSQMEDQRLSSISLTQYLTAYCQNCIWQPIKRLNSSLRMARKHLCIMYIPGKIRAKYELRSFIGKGSLYFHLWTISANPIPRITYLHSCIEYWAIVVAITFPYIDPQSGQLMEAQPCHHSPQSVQFELQ